MHAPTGSQRKRRQVVDYKSITPHIGRSFSDQRPKPAGTKAYLTDSERKAIFKREEQNALAAQAERQAKKAINKKGAKDAAKAFQKRLVAPSTGDADVSSITT